MVTAFSGGFITLLCTVLVDQLTKSLIVYRVGLSKVIPVIPHLNVVHIRNKGISFGIMNSSNVWQQAAILSIAILLCGCLVYQLFQSKQKVFSLCVGAILGGAIGNIIDRIVHGAVIDFIDFYIKEAYFLNLHIIDWHWPAFNVADSAVVVGVIGLVVVTHKPGKGKSSLFRKSK
ncbi:MAG: signal peptidase II [Holosporales bacterium]|nr:signal peptidase II [Holosporales bacterium]